MANIEGKLELLGKLMSDQSLEQDNFIRVYESLYKEINKSFAETLETSTMHSKSSILSDLNQILEDIELLVYYPDFIGRTSIGVIGSDQDTFTGILDKMVSKEVLKSLKMNTNVPSICFDSNTSIVTAFNHLETEVELSENDLFVTTRQLYKNSIDIRSMINCFVIRGALKQKKCSIIHFPDHVIKSSDFKKSLDDKVDTYVVFLNPNDGKSSFKVTQLLKNYDKPIIVCCEDTKIDYAAKLYSKVKSNVKFIKISEITYELDKICTIKENYRFVDSMRLSLCKIHTFYYTFINKYNSRLETINIDLVNIDQSDTEEIVKSIRKSICVLIDESKDKYGKIKIQIERLIKRCIELEILFEEYLHKTSEYIQKTAINPNLIEIWIKLTLSMIDIKDYNSATTYIEKLRKAEYSYIYILDLLLTKHRGTSLNQACLLRLKNEQGIEEIVFKARVALGNELGLDKRALTEAAANISEPVDASEYFFKASSLELSNPHEAIEYYFIALEMGHLKSGERLFDMSSRFNAISIDRLAQNMVPEANYLLGMSIIDTQYAKGLTNIKMAATYGYLPAIEYLAEELYRKIKKIKINTDTAEVTLKKYNSVLNLYKYVLAHDSGNENAQEKIGITYYLMSDFRRAIDYLSKCKTAESFYFLGKIYQYGNGTVQNLELAVDYFYESMKLGNLSAEREYYKVKDWIVKNEIKSARKNTSYRTTIDYSESRSSSSYNSSSSDGGCFITTATCSALNKEDNCEELLVIKEYRDYMILKEPRVKVLIKEYYHLAPEIVIAIDRDLESHRTYLSLWEDYIRKTYLSIIENDFSNATKTYIEMVINLCKRYDIKLSDDAEQAVKHILNC